MGVKVDCESFSATFYWQFKADLLLPLKEKKSTKLCFNLSIEGSGTKFNNLLYIV